MSETEIGSLVNAEIAASIDYDRSSFRKDRVRAIQYMNGEVPDVPYEEGRSSVTSHDVADTIGFMMPGLMRVFFSGDEIVRFEPETPDDEPIAQQATDYINYLLPELDVYEVFWDVFQDALLHANGVVKHWWEPTEKVSVNIFTNLSDNALSLLLSDPTVTVVEHQTKESEIVPPTPQNPFNGGQLPSMPPMMTMLHDVKIKRVQKTGRVRICAVPPEEFLIAVNAKSIREASFVGHRQLNPRSFLIEQGFDPEIVEKLPAFGGTMSFDQVQLARREQMGTWNTATGFDKSMDLVETIECYVKCDYNGDGIAETLKVVMGGSGTSEVLDWEEWEDDYPFTDFVAERVPHRWLGKSIFNQTEDIQRVNTVLTRQLLDNLYASNIPDRVVNEDLIVNMDAVYDRQIGNVIRTTGNPNAAVATSSVPFVAKEALTGLEYMDKVKEARTGVSRNTRALDMQALQNTTATAVNAAQSGAYSMIELVARNFAEMGFKRFFKALLKLIVENQDEPRTIRLRNQWIEFDPKSWNSSMDCTVSVGLGSGSKEKDLMILQGIAAKQEQIIQMAGPNNPLCGIVEYGNTLKKMTEAGGIKNTTQFFKDVNPEQLAQQAGQQKPDPKVAEAQAKIQAQQQEAMAKIELAKTEAAANLQLKREIAQAEFELQRQKNMADLEFLKEKNMIELNHKRELAQINAQLKREELQAEMRLTEQSNVLQAVADAHKSDIDTKIRQQIVPNQ